MSLRVFLPAVLYSPRWRLWRKGSAAALSLSLGAVLIAGWLLFRAVYPLPGAPAGSVASGSPGPGSTPPQRELTIFAAASLSEAFSEIGKSIERASPGTTVRLGFAGSPTLRAQLAQGARADLFASADSENMRRAEKDGSIASTPRAFARNRLVLIVPSRNAARVVEARDLATSGVKLVVGQNDVPAGRYARQALARMSQSSAYGADFAMLVLANIVSEEPDVRKIVTKVRLDEADAGIVYSTDVSPEALGQVTVIAIPDEYNVVVEYQIALVREAANAAGARLFVDYLLSADGQSTLERHGFIRVDSEATRP